MSLLNQMLNDLDRRRADGAGGPALHREIRPLPLAPATSLARPLVVLGGVLLLLLGTAWWWFAAGPGRPLPTRALPPQVAAVALPELAASAPEVPPAAEIETVAPAPLPAAEPLAARPALSLDGKLRLSDQLSLPSKAASVGVPVSASTPAPVSVRAPVAAAIPVVAATLAPERGIDKRPLELNRRDQAERLYRSAVNQLTQGREADGIGTLRAALADDPEHLAARQLLIKLNVDHRAYELAQVDLEEGLRRLPKQTAWAMLLARLRVERGDPGAGLAVLERHEVYAGAAADYQGAMAAMLQRLNRPADAELRYFRAAQSEPVNGRWWLGLGMAREAQGKNAEAREAYRSALAASGLSAELRAFAEAKAQ